MLLKQKLLKSAGILLIALSMTGCLFGTTNSLEQLPEAPIDSRLLEECAELALADESKVGLPEQVAEILEVSSENIKRFVACREKHATLVEVIKERNAND